MNNVHKHKFERPC